MLVHDREIVTRCDDSVATVIAGRPASAPGAWLRAAIDRLARSTSRQPCSPPARMLKNTFCLARAPAVVGPHIGDCPRTDTFAALRGPSSGWSGSSAFRGEHRRIRSASRLPVDSVCHERGGERVPVQHITRTSPAPAEHRPDGAVIGVAFDGTGFGTDGTAWGGESWSPPARVRAGRHVPGAAGRRRRPRDSPAVARSRWRR